MEDTPVLKWTVAALGVIIACFCLGYFVLGPNTKQQQVASVANNPAAGVTEANPSPIQPRATPRVAAVVEDQTGEVEARIKKLEAEKQKALDAQRKAEEALRQKELAAAASPTPEPSVENVEMTPSPAASPVAESGTPPGAETPTAAPAAAPAEATPEPAPPGKSPVSRPPTPAAAEPPKPTTAKIYKVQVGSYNTRDAATMVATELRGRGYSTIIVTEGSGSKGTFHIQVGVYKSKTNAESTLQELQANGYDARLSD